MLPVQVFINPGLLERIFGVPVVRDIMGLTEIPQGGTGFTDRNISINYQWDLTKED